ncbi:vWA domain-containing protein [Pseudovibrio ascidiaceicola]|uniref:vWA domain-containing protein n=1 Tax=Pseudovibrio ascidiaceicola TaxID=285279 RepID=UPI003D365188
MNALDHITKARAKLILQQPFFGCLALFLTPEEEEGLGTMATDGKTLFYDPVWPTFLSEQELMGVLAHEVMHVALEHIIRRGNRDSKRWDMACDYAINPELLAGGFKLPKSGLHRKEFEGLSAESIYTHLEAEEQPHSGKQQQESSGLDDDPGRCGAVRDAAASHDKAGLEATRADIQAKVRQAAMLARKAAGGNLGDGVERLIKQITCPRIDWRDVLHQFINDRVEQDYSWQRPNRRYMQHGIIVPDLVADGITHVVVAVDTSGSINNRALEAFTSEISEACETGALSRLTILHADTGVHKVEEFEGGDPVTIKPVGGGGTDFVNTFKWIEDNAEDAAAVIYFTDLEVRNFGEEPHCPVLWAVWGDERRFDELADRTPFGEPIYLSAN